MHAGARVAMAEVQQLRVQEAVDAMVKSVEKENIRKMQVAARPRIRVGLESSGGGGAVTFERGAVSSCLASVTRVRPPLR